MNRVGRGVQNTFATDNRAINTAIYYHHLSTPWFLSVF